MGWKESMNRTNYPQQPDRLSRAESFRRRFEQKKQRRLYLLLAAILVIISVTLLFFIRIWQRSPQPHFLFLSRDWLSQEIQTDGLVLRDESAYKAPVSGVFHATVPQGNKVAKAATIGQIVPKEDLDALRKLDKATNDVDDRRYELLAEGQHGDAARVFEAGENAILRNLHVLYDALLQGQYEKVPELEMEMRLTLRQRLEDAQSFDFEDDELARLISIRDGLQKSAFDQLRTIQTEASGIFIRQVDGLEKELTPDRALTMTGQELNQYLKTVENVAWKDEVKAGDPLYKLCRSPEEYFACLIPHDYLSFLSSLQNQSSGGLEIYCPANGVSLEDVELVRSESTPVGTILVFRCNQHLEAFVSMRKAPLQLMVKEAEGLRVPKSAFVNYQEGNLEAKLKIVDAGYIRLASVKITESNREYALIEGAEGSDVVIGEGTIILLNPESMQEGTTLGGS